MKKSDREIMEILEAFDATRVAHSAAPLCQADPKTVRPHPGPRLSPAEPADTLMQAIQFRRYQIHHHERHNPKWIMQMPLQY